MGRSARKHRYKCLSELVKKKGRGKASLGSDGETGVEDEVCGGVGREISDEG